MGGVDHLDLDSVFRGEVLHRVEFIYGGVDAVRPEVSGSRRSSHAVAGEVLQVLIGGGRSLTA